MAYTLPVGFSYVAAPITGTATGPVNQYGFSAGSLNFAPATDFQTWNAATIAANKAPAAPVTPAVPVSAPSMTPVGIQMPVQMPAAQPAPVMATPVATPVAAPAPVATPVATPVAAPAPVSQPTFGLPPGFTVKAPVAPTPTPAPVVMPPPERTMPIEQAPTPVVMPAPAPAPAPTPAPVAKPITAPVAGPVTPATPVKAPVMTAPAPAPAPAPVDPRVAALKNSGYTDAQIASAGGAAALLAKINAPRTAPGQVPAKTTAAVNYTWGDLNSAVGALQKANPGLTVQGIPLSKWSTNGVAAIAKTDPAIFKALSPYLPKY